MRGNWRTGCNWASCPPAEKAEHALTYQSGEIAMAGTLTCSTCGKVVHLGKTSVVPVCDSCQGTTFRKGY